MPLHTGYKALLEAAEKEIRTLTVAEAQALQGLGNVCHIGGGYRAWKESGGVSEALPPRG